MLNTKVEFYHNLESYFWLAYLITCNCVGTFNMCHDWDSEIECFNAHGTIMPSLINGLAEIKIYGKALDVNCSTSLHVDELITPMYLLWVCPGVHSLLPLEIVQQRNGVSDTDFANLMTPYFIWHEIVQEGMLELHSLFSSSETQCPDNDVHLNESAPPTIHKQVLSILRHICNSINAAKDQYS